MPNSLASPPSPHIAPPSYPPVAMPPTPPIISAPSAALWFELPPCPPPPPLPLYIVPYPAPTAAGVRPRLDAARPARPQFRVGTQGSCRPCRPLVAGGVSPHPWAPLRMGGVGSPPDGAATLLLSTVALALAAGAASLWQWRRPDGDSRGRAAAPSRPPCAVCGGSRVVECPSCGGMASYISGGRGYPCKSCCAAGPGGTVICRACYEGDPYDLEGIRRIVNEATRPGE